MDEDPKVMLERSTKRVLDACDDIDRIRVRLRKAGNDPWRTSALRDELERKEHIAGVLMRQHEILRRQSLVWGKPTTGGWLCLSALVAACVVVALIIVISLHMVGA